MYIIPGIPSNLLLNGSKEGNAPALPSRNVLALSVPANIDEMSAAFRVPVVPLDGNIFISGCLGFFISGAAGTELSGSESSGLYGSSVKNMQFIF